MPLLPLVTGTGSSPTSCRMVRARSATSTHSARPAPSPGSRSSTSRSGFSWLPCGVHLPLGHMDFQRVDLAEPGQRGGVVDHRIVDGPVLVRDGGPGEPARGRVLQVLLEKHLAGLLRRAHAVDPALPGGRPVVRRGDQDVGHGGVVGQDVRLGGAGLRIDDLVQVGEGQFPPGDPDTLLSAGHRVFTSGPA